MKPLKTLFTLVLTSVLATAAFAGKPQLISKHTKHRDSSVQRITGSSGACQLSAQVLLSGDGSAILEVSTPAPGQITKLTVTHAGLTQNYNHLSSSQVTLNFENVGRGETFAIEGHVKGFDGKRTNVVSLEVPVTLRPDLQVFAFDAPASGTVNVPVFFKATIGETNGDLGADANVILKVDGAEVDRAAIWVDANGKSDATLMHTFTSAGSKSLEVVVTDAAPAEFDATNNSASGQIEITAGNQFLHFAATATEFENYDFYFESTSEYELRSETTRVNSSVLMNGSFGPLDFSSASVELDEFTGTSQLSATFDLSPGASGNCFNSTVNGRSLYVCRASDTVTNFQMFREAGEVTFYSGMWAAEFAGDSGDFYSLSDTYGESIRFGDAYEIRVKIDSGDATYEANPIINLTTTVDVIADQPLVCDAGFCIEIHSTLTTKTGTVSGPLQ